LRSADSTTVARMRKLLTKQQPACERPLLMAGPDRVRRPACTKALLPTSYRHPSRTPVVVPLGVGDGVFDGEGVCDGDRVPEGVSAQGDGEGGRTITVSALGRGTGILQSMEQGATRRATVCRATPAQSAARPGRGVTHMSKSRCRRRFH
jgi:hypothetical protein